MKMEDKIKMAEKNIWQAIDDYRAHTYSTAVLDDVSDVFVHKLAKDNTYFKSELRDLFRKSPVWNEELDALVINGTRTHNPDYERVANLAEAILAPVRMQLNITQKDLLDRALRFFCSRRRLRSLRRWLNWMLPCTRARERGPCRHPIQ